MGLLSSSKSKAVSNISSTTEVTNLNLQDLEGIAAGQVGGDFTIIQSDMNAFDNATELAEKSLEVGAALQADSLASARFSAEQAYDFGGRSLALAENAQSSVESAFSRAASAQQNAYAGALDFGGGAISAIRGAFSDAQDFVGEVIRGVVGQSQESLGTTVTALNTIAKEQSKSTDQRVAEISAGAQKNILMLAGIIAAAILGYAIFKRK